VGRLAPDLLYRSVVEVNEMFAARSEPSPVDFSRVVASVGKALFSRAMGLERSVEDAEDLVQDTLERALRSLHQFQPGTNIRMWLFRIMFNLFVDKRRRRSNEARNDNVEPADLAAPEPDPLAPWEEIDQDKMAATLARLEPQFRDVLQLHLVSQTYREIGATLGIPPGTVGTRLLRARHKLRDILVPMAAAG
jgi:RNA polymerase sigma-70 factor (ECF subfamily)